MHKEFTIAAAGLGREATLLKTGTESIDVNPIDFLSYNHTMPRIADTTALYSRIERYAFRN